MLYIQLLEVALIHSPVLDFFYNRYVVQNKFSGKKVPSINQDIFEAKVRVIFKILIIF